MADLDVTVGVDTAAAEEGLRRLSGQFQREIASIDRSKGEATANLDITKFQKDVVKVKRELLTLQEAQADPEVHLDEKEFKAEVTRLKLELKRLSQTKAEIQVDVQQLKDANRLTAISAKRQESMARQTEKLDKAERAKQATMRKGVLLQGRAIDEDKRREVSLAKLRQEYGKLSAAQDRLANRTGRPLGIFRTPGEGRDLDLVQAKMRSVEREVTRLGGTVDDIDPSLEEHNSILGRWAGSLSDVRLHLGFFSANLKQLGAAVVLLGPAITGLLGSATSLVGVLGTGLAGAATVGSAALAGFGASALGAFLIIKPIVKEVGEATKASEAYHKAVLKYGKGSEQANDAQEKLSQTLKGISPGARSAIKEVGSLKDRWRELTSGARKPVFESAAESIKTASDLMPIFAKNSVRGIEIVTSSWDHWMERLRSGSGKQGLQTIFSNFNAGLPSLLDGFEHLGNIIGRITVSASKMLPSLDQGFKQWAINLDNSVAHGAELDKDIRRLVGHMQDLGHLSQATGRLLVALFNASADSGDGLVVTLTHIFDRWTEWMNTVEGKNSLRNFFSESAGESKKIVALLSHLVVVLFQVSRIMAPISDAFVTILERAGDLVEVLMSIPGINAGLEKTAQIMALIFAANRVRAFAKDVRLAAAALGLMGAAEAGTAAAGGAAAAGSAAGAGAAAAGATGGLMAGLRSIKWGRIGAAGLGIGLLNGIVEEVKNGSAKASDDITKAIGAKLNTESIFEKGTGIHLPDWLNPTANKLSESPEEKALKLIQPALEEVLHSRTKIGKAQEATLRAAAAEVDWTKAQKEQVQAIFRIAQQGRKLHINISGGMDPKQLQTMIHGFQALRSGALASLGDINKVMQRNAVVIANTLPRGSDEARRKTADNFQAAARAIKLAMDNGTISVKKGTDRMRELLRNARLVEGNDPLGLARGFAKSWDAAGGINKRNRDRIIGELRKMPPQARDEAYRFMLQFGKGLVRGKKIPEDDLRQFKSHAIAEVVGIGSGFSTLNASIYTALRNIGDNLSSALKNLGGKPPNFTLKQLMNKLPTLPEAEARLGQQQGGFTVPGSGSGDKVPRALPYGSFVMNREASKAYGFTSGGAVQTILEPKERVFLPREVQAIGPHNLMAMNEAVPRQQGGPVGMKGGGQLGAKPIIEGRASAARDIGNRAVQRVYTAAEQYLEKHRPKVSPGGGYTGPAEGPAGTSMYKGVLMATWVRQALEYGAAHGSGDPQPTSGYRSHAQNVSEGRNYFSEHEKTQYPGGAVDFGGMEDPGSYGPKMAVVNATAGYKYPLLAPVGFRDDGHASGTGHQLGGFALSVGGPTPPPGGEIVGASYYGGPTDSVSGTVGSAGVSLPGKMSFAELAMGKALGGLPYHTKLKIGYNGRSVVAEKLDIGLGGDDVGGHNRAIDLWYETAQAIGMPGTAPVRVAPASAAAAAAMGTDSKKAHTLPKTVKVKHPVYVAGKGGAQTGGTTAGTKKIVESQVPLDIPEFGPIPDKEPDVRRELAHLSHEMLPEYRSALRQHKDQKVIAEHLKASLKKIEDRIRALREKLREIRYAKAKKRFSKKQQRVLGKITGQEGHIEAAQRNYEEKDQLATQIVSQEPEEPGELTPDWLEKVFEPYVNGQEKTAYEGVLGAENIWRNTILTAENIAEGIEKNWEAIIGYPEGDRKPSLSDPNLHFPPRQKNQTATGLADWIYGLKDQIDRIHGFAASHDAKWWNEHPKAKERRDQELASIDSYFKPQMDYSLFRRRTLIGNLGEGRESFNWFAGTGSFEESLQDVQGLHWPDQHNKLGALPGTPVPGVFGGAIWDTQEAMQDLGIKIQQAKESLSDSGTGPDRAAELASFEEAIRSLMQGRPFLSINEGTPWMGAYAKGGVALVGEHGPELAHMPHGTRIHDAEDTAKLLEPQVVVDVSRLAYGPFAQQLAPSAPAGKVINVDQKNYFPTPPPDPHTWARGQVFELEAIA